MNESKIKSLRLDEKTKNLFEQIAEEIGGNQSETINRLCNAYLMQKNKAELPEDRAKILEVEQLTEALLLKFTEEIKTKAILRDQVKQDFLVDLNSKDEVIKSLQDSICKEKEKVEDAEKRREEEKQQLLSLEDDFEQVKKENEANKKKIIEKDELITILKTQTAELNHLRKKQENLEILQVTVEQVKGQLQEKTAKVKELEMKMENINLNAQLIKLQAVQEAERSLRATYESKLDEKEVELKELRLKLSSKEK